MRKNISIKWLIDLVNEFNATSADAYKDEREGKNALLEAVLLEAGMYEGFSYLSADKLKGDAMSVGIREQKEDGSYDFTDTDNTRVKYATHYLL